MQGVLVLLTGDEVDIEDLQCCLGNSSDWKIIEQEEQFYLTSEILNLLDDSDEVFSKVKQVLDVLNGASNIVYKSHIEVESSCIIYEDEKGHRSSTLTIIDTIRARDRVDAVVIKAGGQMDVSNPVVDTWIQLAAKHNSVRDVLFFFKEITWYNLYKIFEVIKEDGPFLNKQETKRGRKTVLVL